MIHNLPFLKPKIIQFLENMCHVTLNDENLTFSFSILNRLMNECGSARCTMPPSKGLLVKRWSTFTSKISGSSMSWIYRIGCILERITCSTKTITNVIPCHDATIVCLCFNSGNRNHTSTAVSGTNN